MIAVGSVLGASEGGRWLAAKVHTEVQRSAREEEEEERGKRADEFKGKLCSWCGVELISFSVPVLQPQSTCMCTRERTTPDQMRQTRGALTSYWQVGLDSHTCSNTCTSTEHVQSVINVRVNACTCRTFVKL